MDDIIDGISLTLNDVFGATKRIYGEIVEQGLKEPCFYISLLQSAQSRLLGDRYVRHYDFDVHYFPSAKENNEEMLGISSDLYEALEYITLLNGDKLRGSELRHEILDGVLHFFVRYSVYLRKVIEHDNMETLTVENNLGGG